MLESNGHALTNAGVDKQFTASKATAKHDDIHQRWVVRGLAAEGDEFHVKSALDGKWLSHHTSLSVSESGAQAYKIAYMGHGLYSLQKENGKYTNIREDCSISIDATLIGYKLYSVTYHK